MIQMTLSYDNNDAAKAILYDSIMERFRTDTDNLSSSNTRRDHTYAWGTLG